MKICDAIVTCLKEFGVEFIFGVSGANIEHIHDSINRLGEGKLVSIMAKHESGAAFMADAHARVHNRLGVCCATSGGGMLNLLVGVAESYMESVPVLALVGQAPIGLEGKGAFQDSSGLEHSVMGEQLWGAVAKYMAKITQAKDFWSEFLECLEAAVSGRPGPAVLLIPRDVFELEVEAPPPDWLQKLRARIVPAEPNEAEIELIATRLRAAKKPVLILGQGIHFSRRQEAVTQFALETGIPVATTMSSIGEYPNQAENYLGMIGMAGHPSVHRYIQQEADLILVVASGLSVLNRGPLGPVIDSDKTVFINLDSSSIKRSFPKAQFVSAEAGDFFAKLLKQSHDLKWSMPASYRRQCYKAVLSKNSDSHNWDGNLLQSQAIGALQSILPTHGHVLFDAGNCAAAAMHYSVIPWKTTATIALGMGGMGYSVGGSIGAQLGSVSDSRTVVFLGDGAFLMVGLEIHTAVALKLPILYVVFNNNQHGMCVTRQQLYFEGRLECVAYPSVDIAGVARGLGGAEALWVGKASSLDEVNQLLDEYQSFKHLPGVLDLRISREEIPPFTAFLPPDAEVIDL
ncbi:MAG: thiamine pyrophosphate-binding protein [Myxococcota bacterium]